MNKEAQTDNKRRYMRADINYSLHYYIDPNAYIEFPHRDISGCGLSFQTDKQYPKGLEMQVSIRLESKEKPILVNGVVARSWQEAGKYYTALDMNQILSADQKIIDEIIQNFVTKTNT